MIRDALESDLPAIMEMLDDFVAHHPSANHRRSLERTRAAHFGPTKVAHLVVATRGDRVVGMAQWSLFFDMFWSVTGVKPEFLYVRPDVRGIAIAAALIADVCARARAAGAEFLQGNSYEPEVTAFYDRFTRSWPAMDHNISDDFAALADLAGKPVRDIVRGLAAIRR